MHLIEQKLGLNVQARCPRRHIFKSVWRGGLLNRIKSKKGKEPNKCNGLICDNRVVQVLRQKRQELFRGLILTITDEGWCLISVSALPFASDSFPVFCLKGFASSPSLVTCYLPALIIQFSFPVLLWTFFFTFWRWVGCFSNWIPSGPSRPGFLRWPHHFSQISL